MDEERPASGNPVLSLLASSAGISGLLVVIGFFIQQGIRSIIGVNARQPSDVSAYLLDDAYFVEETLSSLAGQLIAHWKAALAVIILLAAALGWLVRRSHRNASRVGSLLHPNLLFIVVTIALLLKLFMVDWTVMTISGFFRKPAVEARGSDFSAPGVLVSTNEIWRSLLRAHSSSRSEHAQGRSRLEAAYALYVLLGVLLIAASLAGLRAKRDDLRASILICYALLQLFLIAYAYGKFERSTFYPCVALSLRDRPDQNAIMLSEDGQSVIVFSAADDRFHRHSWSEIKEITTIGEEDIFAIHLLAMPKMASELEKSEILGRITRAKLENHMPRCMDHDQPDSVATAAQPSE